MWFVWPGYGCNNICHLISQTKWWSSCARKVIQYSLYNLSGFILPKPSGDSWSFLCQSVSCPRGSLSKKFRNFMYYILTCFHFVISGIKINFYCWLLQDPTADSTRTDRYVSGLYQRHTRWTPGDTGLRQGLHIWLCIWHECPTRRCVPHLCRSTC